MDEYTNEQILAIEEFARGLRECYNNKSKDADPLTNAVIWYVLQVIDIHLALAQIKFDRFASRMAEYHGQ